MAEYVRVIMEIPRVFRKLYNQDPKTAFCAMGKEEFCRNIYNDAILYLQHEHHDIFGETGSFAHENVDEHWFVGVDAPEDIRDISRNWNSLLQRRFELSLKKFEDVKQKLAMPTLYSVFDSFDHGLAVESFNYKRELELLKRALAAYSEKFAYGVHEIVVSDDEEGYHDSTRLNPDALCKIQEHPENYAVFFVHYR